MRTSPVRLDDIERLGTAVVGAVEDGTRRETEGETEFVAGCTCACITIVLSAMSPTIAGYEGDIPRLDILLDLLGTEADSRALQSVYSGPGGYAVCRPSAGDHCIVYRC